MMHVIFVYCVCAFYVPYSMSLVTYPCAALRVPEGLMVKVWTSGLVPVLFNIRGAFSM